MPNKSHIRWVRDHFLSMPEVRLLAPQMRIKRQTLVLTSTGFKDGICMIFNRDSGCVCLYNQWGIADIYEYPDMAPVRLRSHQFKCQFCEMNGRHERFLSLKAMYLDHCIAPMLDIVLTGKYQR
jgi:hypothetical protein